MKKVYFFSILFVISFHPSLAQINKHNWIMGGQGSYSYEIWKSDLTTVKLGTLRLTPKVGYFLADKFCVGLNTTFESLLNNNTDYQTAKYTYFYFGPFIRYYLLKPANRYNIFIETCYQYYLSTTKNVTSRGTDHGSSYSFEVGPVIFLNSVIGVEFGLKYEHKNVFSSYTENIFMPSIGFQIHLQKEE